VSFTDNFISCSPSLNKMEIVKSVHFPRDPVTMTSRVPSEFESAILDRFEAHMRTCKVCRQAVFDTPFISDELCIRGVGFARDVATLFYSPRDGKFYRTSAPTNRPSRVEVSPRLRYVWRLYRVDNRPRRAQRPALSKKVPSRIQSRVRTHHFTLPLRMRPFDRLYNS
jgi:hypothetical protein